MIMKELPHFVLLPLRLEFLGIDLVLIVKIFRLKSSIAAVHVDSVLYFLLDVPLDLGNLFSTSSLNLAIVHLLCGLEILVFLDQPLILGLKVNDFE